MSQAVLTSRAAEEAAHGSCVARAPRAQDACVRMSRSPVARLGAALVRWRDCRRVARFLSVRVHFSR
jgi:hypothetical protein